MATVLSVSPGKGDQTFSAQKEKQYESLIATPSNVKKMLATAGTAASALGTISTLYNNYNAVAKIGKNLIASKKIQNRMSTMKVHSE